MNDSTPLVVGNRSWSDMIPKWLLDEVASQRQMLGLIQLLKPDIETVSDAEVLAYMMPATMIAPMRYEFAQIYLYLATKVCRAHGKEIPDDIAVEELRPDWERELKDLRGKIYRSRGGEVKSPLLNVMRDFKKTCDKRQKDIDRNGPLLF